jgi:hypothetical protein
MHFDPPRLEVHLALDVATELASAALLQWSEPGPVLSKLHGILSVPRDELERAIHVVDISSDEDATEYLVNAFDLLTIAVKSVEVSAPLMRKMLRTVPRSYEPKLWDCLARRCVLTNDRPFIPDEENRWRGPVHILGGIYQLPDGSELQLVHFGHEDYRLHFIQLKDGISKTFPWDEWWEPHHIVRVENRPIARIPEECFVRATNGSLAMLSCDELQPKDFTFFQDHQVLAKDHPKLIKRN